MRITNLLKTLLILYATTSFLYGATLRPSEADMATIRETIDFVYADSFAAARVSAESINDTLSGRPIYHLIFASVLHAEMADAEDYSNRKEFFAHIDSSMKVLKDENEYSYDDFRALKCGVCKKGLWEAEQEIIRSLTIKCPQCGTVYTFEPTLWKVLSENV